MRIRVIQKPTEHAIDGFSLDSFVVGRVYDVDRAIATVFVAEGWGVPLLAEVATEPPRQEPVTSHGERKRTK